MDRLDLTGIPMAHQTQDHQRTVSIPIETPVWGRFFTVAPLVIVGTREGGGGYDLAPKHMAMPLGWENYYCFVCSPRHATQHNAERTGEFTVSFPRPDQILETSMAAGPRVEDGSKPTLGVLRTFAASAVDGVLVEGAYLWLECELDRMLEGFGDNTLIIGKVVAASVDERFLSLEGDERDPIRESPLLAYVSPGRYAKIGQSSLFPFHVEFRI
jgi:flavin reductase (DIM6/NTAB) family NADH-FMN oxidoreductase RutF